MNKDRIRSTHATVLPFLMAAAALAGCASVAVHGDDLTQRTSAAIGLMPDQFEIFDRSDKGVRTDYRVRTKSGKSYSCYVTGMVSVTGRTVSDAICAQIGAGSSPAEARSTGSTQPCNALLKAAGKCR